MDLIHVFKVAVYIALIFIGSGIGHELGHLVMCYALKCKLIELKIFVFKISYDNGLKIKFTVKEKEHCTFSSNSKVKMMKIMMMGPIVNLIFSLFFGFALFSIGFSWITLFGFCLNIYLFGFNLLPSTYGDGYMITETYKEIRSEMKK